MKQDDLTLGALLEQTADPESSARTFPPRLPPYFCSIDRERRARMVEQLRPAGAVAGTGEAAAGPVCSRRRRRRAFRRRVFAQDDARSCRSSVSRDTSGGGGKNPGPRRKDRLRALSAQRRTQGTTKTRPRPAPRPGSRSCRRPARRESTSRIIPNWRASTARNGRTSPRATRSSSLGASCRTSAACSSQVRLRPLVNARRFAA